MFLNTKFEYDGINSDTMGVSLVSINTDLIEMPFGYKRTIKEEKIPFKDNPYFFGYEKECLTLKIIIAKINEDDTEWTYDDLLKITEWFYKGDYRPFISLDNPEIIYYCTPVDSNTKSINCLNNGYVTINLRCNSPFAYSPTYINTYDFQVNDSNILQIENKSNVVKYYYPEIQIEVVDGTDFSIKNLTNGGEEFKFTGLTAGEKVYINNDVKQIISSLPNTYRLSNFNKNWLRLVKGVNRLQIIGDVKSVIRCSYPISI